MEYTKATRTNNEIQYSCMVQDQQKAVVILYSSNKQSQREIRKAIYL